MSRALDRACCDWYSTKHHPFAPAAALTPWAFAQQPEHFPSHFTTQQGSVEVIGERLCTRGSRSSTNSAPQQRRLTSNASVPESDIMLHTLRHSLLCRCHSLVSGQLTDSPAHMSCSTEGGVGGLPTSSLVCRSAKEPSAEPISIMAPLTLAHTAPPACIGNGIDLTECVASIVSCCNGTMIAGAK